MLKSHESTCSNHFCPFYARPSKHSIYVVPLVEHKMCAHHIYANWRKKHRLQEYQKRFWKIAKAPNEQLFKYYKNKLVAKTPQRWQDLEKTNPIHWSRVGLDLDQIVNQLITT